MLIIIILIEFFLGTVFLLVQPLCEPCLDEENCPYCISNRQIFLLFLMFLLFIFFVIKNFKKNPDE